MGVGVGAAEIMDAAPGLGAGWYQRVRDEHV